MATGLQLVLLLLSTFVLHADRQTVGSPTNGAIIVGQVIDDESRRGVSEAAVTLSAPNTPDVAVLTDADGRFFFAGVAAAGYQIAVKKSGYLDGAYGKSQPASNAGQLVLQAGTRRGDIQIRLWKPATLAGRVINEGSDPLVGVDVQILRRTYLAGRRVFQSLSKARTDDRGAFRISGLSPGDYAVGVLQTQITFPLSLLDSYFRGELSATARQQLSTIGLAAPPDNQSSQAIGGVAWQVTGRSTTPPPTSDGLRAYAAVFYPSGRSVRTAQVITLKAGETRSSIDLQLALSKAVTIAGRLVDSQGPVADTTLRMIPEGTSDFFADTGFETAITLSDTDGRFTFVGVTPGTYAIQVTKRRYETAVASSSSLVQLTPNRAVVSSGASTTAPPKVLSTLWARQSLTVGSENLEDIEVPLREGISVRGTVIAEGVTDPVARAAVMKVSRVVLDRIDGRQNTVVAVLPTDDGTFALTGAEPGDYFVRVVPSSTEWTARASMVRGVDVSDKPLTITDGDVSDVVVTMTNHPSELSGAVTGVAKGQSITVAICPVERAYWTNFGNIPRRLRQVTAADDGTFRILGLPDGQYFLAAYGDDVEWRDIGELFDVLSTAGVRIEVANGRATPAALSLWRRR